GGFDPLPLAAQSGDTLELTIESQDSQPQVFGLTVTGRRRPSVVRVNPPASQRDVPLNSVIVVVFSEPVDPISVTANAVQVLANGAPVPGRLVVASDGIRVEFDPAQPLQPGVDYQLMVASVRDLDGDSLARSLTTTFATGPGAT